MKKALESMHRLDTSDEEYNQSDLQFHVLIARAAKNPILESFMNAIQPLILEAIELGLNHNYRPEITSKYHENIYEGIVLKDPDLAPDCMREDLEATEQMIAASKLIIGE